MKTPILLMVEDDPGTRGMIRAALDRTEVEILEASEGPGALALLEGWRDEDPQRPWPALVLLDLGLPGMGGLDVLRTIRSQEATRLVPVVIFSSDDHPLVVRAAYAQGANGYLTKPMGAKAFEETVQAVGAFWLGLNRPAP